MRALGARRSTVLSIILLEAGTLSLLGGLAGHLLGRVLSLAAGAVLAGSTGVRISALAVQPAEFLVLAGVLALGALAGLLPALKAYRTDIADGLNPTS
jgi:putative ABC transport system permease protein